jgi:hypothetical protein
MSVNAIVTVPSAADVPERSGRDALTDSAMSSTDVDSRKPCSSLVDGTELWHCTIFQSPCSRCSTQVSRSLTGPVGPSNSVHRPAHPTPPSTIACTSPTCRHGYPPPISRICCIHTSVAASPSCHHSAGSDPKRSKPGCLEIRLLTASSSPSRTDSTKRLTTRRSSSDGSMAQVSCLPVSCAIAPEAGSTGSSSLSGTA